MFPFFQTTAENWKKGNIVLGRCLHFTRLSAVMFPEQTGGKKFLERENYEKFFMRRSHV